MNITRIVVWLRDIPHAHTRLSRFAALADDHGRVQCQTDCSTFATSIPYLKLSQRGSYLPLRQSNKVPARVILAAWVDELQ